MLKKKEKQSVLTMGYGSDKANGFAKMSKRELIQEVNAVKAENEAMKAEMAEMKAMLKELLAKKQNDGLTKKALLREPSFYAILRLKCDEVKD